ncbi:hypothetical protein AAIB46_32165, partial [Streptomyces sp. 35M1]|uniref:hypothetical protein n=1 Tax=Streptomyces sp. 35M1 TaxID=3142978 RepID=UPI0039905C82
LRGAAMVLVVLLRQDRNPGIRDSTNLSTAQSEQQPQFQLPGLRRGQLDSEAQQRYFLLTADV